MNASFSITRSEAYALMRCSGSDLLRLMQRAAALRDTCKGKVITYSRKVFIPLTNLCRISALTALLPSLLPVRKPACSLRNRCYRSPAWALRRAVKKLCFRWEKNRS